MESKPPEDDGAKKDRERRPGRSSRSDQAFIILAALAQVAQLATAVIDLFR